MLQLFLILIFFPLLSFAQLADSLAPPSPPQPVDVNFLFNYYEQDGEHAAVTGGIGTQELTDRSMIIVVHVPLDSTQSLDVRGGLNTYTSASTDRIDSRLSSASRKDSRGRVYLQYNRDWPQKRQGFHLFGGGSIESDYLSTALGGGWTWTSRDQNRTFDAELKLYLDTWILIFPEEIRGTGLDIAPTNRRRSFNLSFTLTQVLNKRLQAAFLFEPSFQQGMLATPFHRVYFPDVELPQVEKLPTARVKLPLGVRLNAFLKDFWVLRAYGRLYWDSFGVWAQTISVESPLKFGVGVSLYPFYRLHHQRGSRYFQPYEGHLLNASFFTSDYDLSSFTSHKYGVGLHLEPLFGLTRFKLSHERIGLFKSVDFRYTRYQRSDGLKAFILGLDLGFSF